LRETFFCHHLSAKYKLHVSGVSDFLVEKKYTFEVGGKNKGNYQIAAVPNSFVANDTIEYGFANHIPLWMFGFLY